MEDNLNESEKRKRKRIVVKRDPNDNQGDGLSHDKPVKENINVFQNSRTPYNKPFQGPNPNHRPYNKFNSGKSFGKSNSGFKPGFKKDFSKEPYENPLLKHQFFKKHEANPAEIVPIPSIRRVGNDSIRLNKYISNSGVCSRREADLLIASGAIKVNGETITVVGTKINIKDAVEFKGKRIFEANHVYILLNKPKDTITTTDDPEKRVTVMDLVQKATDQRIFPIGRLDRNTTGVILLTNDGDFAQKLSHPSSEVKKVYYAILDKALEKEHFDRLVEGIELEDGPMKVDEIAYVDPNDHTMIGVEIHSGKNRIVHRMFENLGYRLKKLDRVVYAGLDKGGLRRGKWRFLKFNEIQNVINTIKLRNEKSN